MHIISLDIETTGLVQARDHVLSVAMLSFDPLAKELKIDSSTAVEYRLLWGHIHGEPRALAMNAALLDDIAAAKAAKDRKAPLPASSPLVNYIEPNMLAEAMSAWLMARGFEKPTVTGKNAGSFDIPFIRFHCSSHFKSWGPMPKMRHRCLDIGSLLYNPADDLTLPDTEECAIRLNVFPRKPESYGYALPGGDGSHCALPDAVLVADMIQAYYSGRNNV